MLIDWFTVLAQIVNFLVLVALLRHFLYHRIIRAMDEREEKIASRLKEADRKKEEAEREAQSYREKNDRFDAERDEMQAKAREEVQARRRELMHAARDEVESTKMRWLDAIREERESFLHELTKMMCREVYTTSSHALRDLADAKIEQRMVSLFSEKIHGLDINHREKAPGAPREGAESISVRTAFELSDGIRKTIEDLVRNRFSTTAPVEFETAPDLICGIELNGFDHKVGWSFADYLEGLEERVSKMIETESKGFSPGGSEGREEH